MVTLYHYLLLSSVVFALGAATVVFRKNAVGVLVGVELILNAANINFVAFSRYTEHVMPLAGVSQPVALDGQVFAIFVMILAACEAAIALAIIINIFNRFGSIDVDEPSSLRG
ncbi:MAG: NADH-quinone oxidoreductase subunit NuoK [Candidatus Sumerlaeaceae bacterium]|nr:NADH-quinone oxidoreductase subunit NuoK [Candidatus Sumerlaeaceae bacterium]